MRLTILGIVASVFLVGTLLQAKPNRPDAKDEPAPAFKPLSIKGVLDADDPKDDKLNNPSKKFKVKLAKDRTYVIDMVSQDFDAYLRLLDKKGKQVAEDDDGGGDLNSRLFFSPSQSGDHTIVATSFDGMVGKFTLKVRELNLKGEAKIRKLGNNGLTINAELGENDKTDLDKLSKVFSVELKGNQTYLFEVDGDGFDPQIYVFDAKGKLLGQDPDKVACSATADGPHHLVVKSFDGQVGKFELKVRPFTIKGEAKPRPLGKDGLTIKGNIAAKHKTTLGKLGLIYSVELKGGQEYVIDMEGQNLTSDLYLFDSKSAMAAHDDGSADPDARITFTPERDGIYHILATTVDGKETGEFTLAVRKKE
jgi:Bacterial pre-peptidase C-terminal domain